ncbi:AAA family ATPase [Escherichia coli]|nr:AAA family ATPase [Escherichia coli]
MIDQPLCTILAGPNGSGKSSLVRALKPDGVFINADLIARDIAPADPEAATLAAGRATLKALDVAISGRETFVYETTLSSRQSIALMERCRAAGYRIELVFVMLETVELNLRRIAERVANGGHDIPEVVVRRRHASAFRRIPVALGLADAVMIFDNSNLEPRLLVTIESGVVKSVNFDDANSLHRNLANVVLGRAN